MRNLLRVSALGVGLVAGLSLHLLFFAESSITFESRESKTQEGKPVYNRIKFISGWNQDIWLMQQSHNGLNVDSTTWDRLAIVVNKRMRPYKAEFYQFKPGEFQFGDPTETAPFHSQLPANW